MRNTIKTCLMVDGEYLPREMPVKVFLEHANRHFYESDCTYYITRLIKGKIYFMDANTFLKYSTTVTSL